MAKSTMTHIIDDDIAWSPEKMLEKIIAGFQTLPRFGFGFGKPNACTSTYAV